MLRDWRKERPNKKSNRIVKKDNHLNDKINIKNIKKIFDGNYDFKIKEITCGKKNFYFFYLETFVDTKMIDQYILKPIIEMSIESGDVKDVYEKVKEGFVPHTSSNIRVVLNDVVEDILTGHICFVSSSIGNNAITFQVKKIEKRSINEPTNENIIKGSKETFVEDFQTNITLIRNRIKSKDLKVNKIDVGDEIKTTLAVIYLDSKVDKGILEKVRKKIEKIETNKLITGADFEEQIIDNKYSIFPQLIYTEKTDKVISNIVEGKIIVVIDGLPIVYILPAVVAMFLQTPEDYSISYAMGSVIRIIRYIAVLITLVVPAFYVCVTEFHQELIPTELALSMISSKEGVPFPTIIEVVFMLLAIEILIEASSRLPKAIGQTISIVGGLIIGEAAVSAKLVSPAVVVIIAFAGVTGFLIPNQDFSNAIRICRFILVISSGLAGLYGLYLSLFMIFYYMSTIESFGVPYFVPFSSNDGKNLTKDTIFRSPMLDMRKINDKR